MNQDRYRGSVVRHRNLKWKPPSSLSVSSNTLCMPNAGYLQCDYRLGLGTGLYSEKKKKAL
jgi:hypothetical protein